MTEIPLKSKFGGQGKVGKPIQLVTNFYKTKIQEGRIIHHYDVQVESVKTSNQELPKKLNREVITEFIRTYEKSMFKNLGVAYDGVKNIYTSAKINEKYMNNTERKKFEVTWAKPGGKGSEDFIVALRWAQEIPLAALLHAIDAKRPNRPQFSDPKILMSINALDVALMQGTVDRKYENELKVLFHF